MVAFAKTRFPLADSPRPSMRLVPAQPDEPATRPQVLGRIDRRLNPRRALSLRVSGRRLDHSVEARRDPCLHLSMNDVSVGGLSAISQNPLQVGERVAVFFPPEGSGRGWDAYGRVLRVTPQQQGYRIAVSFEPLHAA